MKRLVSILLLGTNLVTSAQTASENFILTSNYHQATQSTDLSKSNTSISYYDGLGRQVQIIENKMSGDGTNLVTPITYDAFGRQSMQHLPYTNAATDLNYVSDPISDLQAFYAGFREGTGNPYSETVFEPSPLNRIMETAAPGDSWEKSAGHTIKFSYQANAQNEVILFKVPVTTPVNGVYEISLVNAGSYPAGELYKTVTMDENWSQNSHPNYTTEEFKDKEGRLVLKRTYSNSEAHDTYYIYDVFGNLTYVVPPLADAGSLSQNSLDALCYQYKYDHRNRLIEKKLPGKRWEYIVYDLLDRPILSGPMLDPFGGSSLGWVVTKYDEFGRVAFTAWHAEDNPDPGAAERNAYQAMVSGQQWEDTQHESPITTAEGIPLGYSNTRFIYHDLRLLTINYYDDYLFPGAPTEFLVGGYDNTRKPVGLQTGSWVRVLNPSQTVMAEQSYTLYDHKGRPIRQHSSNHLGGFTRVDTELDFLGKPLTTRTTHQKDINSPQHSIKDNFTYNSQQRLVSHTQQVDSEAPEQISISAYDELGTVKEKSIGGVEGGMPLQIVDFKYNVRGWLTSINNLCNLEMQGQPEDLFAFGINYDHVSISSYVQTSPLYNGNISETYWKSASDNVLRKYAYGYDSLNRIRRAYYYKPSCDSYGVNSDTYSGFYDEYVEGYDKNGNILSLKRNGDNDAFDPAVTIDELSYHYEGNRLLKVTDLTNNYSGFSDDSNGTNDTQDDYSYDDFGNMIKDQNKRITKITYNHLNLPVNITVNFMAKIWKINYLYNATGKKISKTVYQDGAFPPVQETTLYLDGFQYRDNVLQFIAQPEGYVRATQDPAGNYRFSYVYQYKDHLGNIRMNYAWDAADQELKILNEDHYYPFGLKHLNYSSGRKDFRQENAAPKIKPVPYGDRNPYLYKYQGQEWQDELGLNWYSFKWRNSDPATGRFMSIDPLAEDYPYNSPYAFAENRVVDGRELEGLEWASSTSSDGKTVNLSLNVRVVNNTSNNLTNAQVATLASERAQYLTNTIGGKDAQGRTVNVSVNQSNDATMVWEYNTALSADGVKELAGKPQNVIDNTLGQALGIVDEIGNTQVNRSQVNVGRSPTMPYSDDTGLPDFNNKEARSKSAQVGNHEDGHTLGLRHENDTKNPSRTQQGKDPNNLMNWGADGSNVSPQQRSQAIQLIEQQQKK